MSEASVEVRTRRKQHFGPGYDLSYRFQVPNTFNRSGKFLRPHTTSGSISAADYRTGQFHRAYLSAIATAQLTTGETFRPLGDGLMMLQADKRVYPSIFSKLDKMYMYDVSTEKPGHIVGSRLPLNSAPARMRRRKLPRTTESPVSVLARSGREIKSSSSEYRKSSNIGKIVVEFLTKAERQERQNEKIYRPRSEYSLHRRENDDKCSRCSNNPEILIDGRSIGQNNRVYGEYLPREHCDVLGPLSCPDCIRTRAQNNHLRMCRATTEANATEVYKIALIHERIPYLTSREVQRKVYDGEISNHVDPVSKWKEIKHNQIPPPSTKSDHDSQGDLPVSLTVIENTDKARSKLKSSSSVRPTTFETIPESSESLETNASPEMNTGTSKKNETNTKNMAHENTESNIHNEEIPSSHIESDVVLETPRAVTAPATSGQSSRRKKSPKRKLKIFNRHVIPSPNYFHNVSDLMERIKKYHRIRRKNSWDVDVDRDRATILPQQELDGGDDGKQDRTKDDASSVSSQESSAVKRESLKVFEPPVMYGSKARYLGAKTVESAV